MFCYIFPTGRVHSSAFIFSRLHLFGNIHCICLEHDHPIVHSKTVRASYQFCIPYGTSAKLHSARTCFIFPQPPYGPFDFNTVRYFFKTFTQPVRVSFVHNYHSPFEFNTVRYFFKTLIQPVRVSFVQNYRTVL